MAVHNGFDNKLYVNVWERKQDRLCKLNFEVLSYFNLFSLSPTNFLFGSSIIYPKQNWLGY